jgi:hypothetical protein
MACIRADYFLIKSSDKNFDRSLGLIGVSPAPQLTLYISTVRQGMSKLLRSVNSVQLCLLLSTPPALVTA